jgi:signal transduction histidine kinase
MTHRSRGLADRLPLWMGSIRLRLTIIYSVLLFGLGALVVLGIYTGLSRSLGNESMTASQQFIARTPDGVISGDVITAAELERAINRRTLDNLRNYSLTALGLLFAGSLGVGWYVSGLMLRPISRITTVANDIQARDLSRRINLSGPNDELRQLADTFDAMLARLDAAFESQRRFIQEASHELRNPLAVIRTNLEVVMSDPDASVADFREVGAVVSRTSARMSTLVDDLVLYARREEPANRAGLIDVAPLVSEAAAEFRVAAESKSVSLDAIASPGLWVHGDATAIRQALANLLVNAIRHAPDGSAVRVAGGTEEAWVWLAVEDQGPGIAPEDQDKVWTRFWRGDRKRAREEARSGLGLTIVRQIIERHNGRVQLLSEIGRGSTFVLWFPAAEGPEPTPGRGMPVAAPVSGPVPVA